MKTFRLEVITPDRAVYDGQVASVTVPTEGGAIGILYNHAPLVSTLSVGVLTVNEAGGGTTYLMVGEGFVEIRNNHVRVLAEVGEREDQIDVERAAEAEKRARERLKARKDADFDLVRVEAALARALMRQRILKDLAPRKRSSAHLP